MQCRPFAGIAKEPMDIFELLPRYLEMKPIELERLRSLRQEVVEATKAFFSAAKPERANPAAIQNFATVLVTFAPRAWSVEDCLPFSLYATWAGLIKEYHMDHPTLARSAEYRRSVGNAARAGLGDHVGDVDPRFHEVTTYLRDLLQRIPLGRGLPDFLTLFKNFVRREMASEICAWKLAEAAANGEDVLVEDYLESASWTIEVRSHQLLALQLLTRAAPPISSRCLAELRLAFDAASVGIRLINDFASSNANNEEGVLSIYSFGWAKDDVVRRAYDFLDRVDIHVARAETMGLEPAYGDSIRTHVRVAVEAYHAADLRSPERGNAATAPRSSSV
jgi:hypothetical protein